MTKYSLEEMLKRDYGRILLIASIAGKEAREGVVTFKFCTMINALMVTLAYVFSY